MGKFEVAIPTNIKLLEKELARLYWTIADMQRPYNHDCDCEYCTVDPDPIPDNVQEQIDEVEIERSEIRALVNRLKRHAKFNGVEIEE